MRSRTFLETLVKLRVGGIVAFLILFMGFSNVLTTLDSLRNESEGKRKEKKIKKGQKMYEVSIHELVCIERESASRRNFHSLYVSFPLPSRLTIIRVSNRHDRFSRR